LRDLIERRELSLGQIRLLVGSTRLTGWLDMAFAR